MSSVTVLQSIVWSFVLSYLKLFSLLQEYWWNQVVMIKLWETKPWKTFNHCCYNLLELNRIMRQISACIYEWWCKTQPEVSLCLLYWVGHKWCFKGRGVKKEEQWNNPLFNRCARFISDAYSSWVRFCVVLSIWLYKAAVKLRT